MIKVSHLRKEFELSRQQQKELNTTDKKHWLSMMFRLNVKQEKSIH